MFIELSRTDRIPILYEDRAVLAVDKPRGWMLVPFTWQRTDRNLQAALVSSIAAGHFWARSRNLKFLRHVHRLDADTTGILLLAKSIGTVNTFSDLFESRQMEKRYLAVVEGIPSESEWTCRLALAPVPGEVGRMHPDVTGKSAETAFRVLQTVSDPVPRALIEAMPYTGRTHQIRVHLATGKWPIVGDPLYGHAPEVVDPRNPYPMGLRAVSLAFRNPFTGRAIRIKAPSDDFLRQYGFEAFPKVIHKRDMEDHAGSQTGKRVQG